MIKTNEFEILSKIHFRTELKKNCFKLSDQNIKGTFRFWFGFTYPEFISNLTISK